MRRAPQSKSRAACRRTSPGSHGRTRCSAVSAGPRRAGVGVLGPEALSRLVEAVESQRQALEMLGGDKLVLNFFNRRAWVFTLSDGGVNLPVIEEKRCYARMGEAASRRLAGVGAMKFPPPGCGQSHLRALVADDLCRYVEPVQSLLAPAAQRLRQILGPTEPCLVPRVHDARHAN